MEKNILFQGSITVKKSPVQGYGVFATADIEEGAIVEECYTIPTKIRPGNKLMDYVFKLDDKDKFALLLGYGSLYNHSKNANINNRYNDHTKLTTFFATKRIKEGEELLHDYGDGWFESRKLNPKSPKWYHLLYHTFKRPLRAGFVMFALFLLFKNIQFLFFQ